MFFPRFQKNEQRKNGGGKLDKRKISSMASTEFNSSSLKFVLLTINCKPRVVCFPLLIIIFSLCTKCSAVLSNNTGAHLPLSPDQKVAEIHKRLREINKPAVKSIQSPDGDIIDCILFHQQPAFDNPLLKNFTMPRIPTTTAFDMKSSSMVNRTSRHLFQTWHRSGISCPKGTIPVRRTSVDDLMRFYGKMSGGTPGFGIKIRQMQGHEYSAHYIHDGNRYFGSSMILNIWNPMVENNEEFSEAAMWVMAGDYDTNDLNCVQVGWQVYPALYGDVRTRLFTFWTSDTYRNGCYNLQCDGFVQTAEEIALGGAFETISQEDGKQYDNHMMIRRDDRRDVWWLELEGLRVGYWPAEIFTTLRDDATTLKWGGEITNYRRRGRHTQTQMGSGRFATRGFGVASYIRNIRIVDANQNERDLRRSSSIITNPNCYNNWIDDNDRWGGHFYFGGPGWNQLCP